MTLRYAPGEARALVRGGAVVLLPAPVDVPVLEQLWDQLGAEPRTFLRKKKDQGSGNSPTGISMSAGAFALIAAFNAGRSA